MLLLIAISGYGQPEDRERSKAVGFDHHLVKPIDCAELLALMRSGVGTWADGPASVRRRPVDPGVSRPCARGTGASMSRRYFVCFLLLCAALPAACRTIACNSPIRP